MKKKATGKKKPTQQKRPTQQKKAAPQENRPVQQMQRSAAPKKTTKKPQAKKTAKPAADRQNTQGTAPKATAAPVRSKAKAPLKKQGGTAKRGAIGRKRGSRGGNYSLYYICGAILLVIVFIILANTVLFDCTYIEVEGNLSYTAEDITRLSGIKLGDNLMKTDFEAAEQSIVSSFPYIDIAEINRTSPTKIKIIVTEAEKWYCMRFGSQSYIISRRGKVLEQGVDSALPVIIGYEADSPTVGSMLASKVEGKTSLPSLVLTAAETAGLTDITSINITDRFEIEVEVNGRITLQLGNSTELESKMYVAKVLVDTKIGATESVTVDLTNPEKVPVRDNNIVENLDEVPIIAVPQTAESTAEPTAEAE